MALLAVLYSSRAARHPAAPAPAARSSPPPPPPQPLPQVERALLQGEEEGPDELESLVRSLGQQLRSSRWVEEELARKAAAGEPLVRIFDAPE